jgi:chondroitin AC lyase
MFQKVLFFKFILLLLSSSLAYGQQKSDFEIILARVHSEYQKTIAKDVLDKEVKNILSQIEENGSWKDINYQDQSLSRWQPDLHFKRVGKMARAYSNPKSNFYQDSRLYDHLLSSMRFWTKLDPEPKSDNWWWMSISIPQEIGRTLTTLRFATPKIPEELEKALLDWMEKGVPMTKSPGKDGSNLTDIAQHRIIKASLSENSELLSEAVALTAASIKITTGDGIQRDMSFHAHGPELYMHGYGREYLSGIRNIAVYITGTGFSFSKEQLEIISEFTRNGYLQSMRGRYIDYSVLGRGIARSNATRTNSTLIKQIQAIDDEKHREEYQHAIDRIDGNKDPSYHISPRNIHYWRSDYTIHHRPEFMVSVNIASSRTIRTESGNKENLTGQFLTEGAMNISVKGDEYFNIFPNWDWSKIPGTTTPENKNLLKRTNWVANRGNSDFAGGLSDGLDGIAVYRMNDYDTKAKKAWFFFDNKIICLGAEINAKRAENITTTINQSRLRGPVQGAERNDFQEVISTSSLLDPKINWIFHDGVGYFFPKENQLHLQAGEKSGAWSEINGNSSSKIIKQQVFKLWINHGVNPKNSSYSYFIVPGVKDLNSLQSSGVEELQILRNDGQIQAIHDQSKKLTGAVFYQKGNIKWENKFLSSSDAALVQVRELSPGTWQISLSEPTQKLKGKIKVIFKVEDKKRIIDFVLPKGDLAGSTLVKEIALD